MNLPTLDANEPVRRSLYLAATVVALGTFFGALALATAITPQVIFGALSVGLLQFAAIAFGVEHARQRTYGPETANELMDADAVIRRAEHG